MAEALRAIDAEAYKMNIKHLPAGMYAIRIDSNQKIYNNNFVKR